MSAERWITPNNTLDVFKSFYGEIANLPFFIQTWLHPNGIDSDAKKLFSAVETLTGISILAALSRVNSLSQRTANKTQVSIAATELNDRFGAIHPEVAVTALPVAAALADNANETFDQSQLAANETLPIVSEVMTVIYQAIMILTLKLAELQKKRAEYHQAQTAVAQTEHSKLDRFKGKAKGFLSIKHSVVYSEELRIRLLLRMLHGTKQKLLDQVEGIKKIVSNSQPPIEPDTSLLNAAVAV